jgi:hypothetical protein
MHESADDFQRLQAQLDASIEKASPFLRRSFDMPDRSLSAAASTCRRFAARRGRATWRGGRR